MNTLWKKFYDIIKSEIQKGLSAHKLALAISFGVSFGVFPIVGTSSLFCFLIAICLKLNHVVIQTTNYLVYPLQFILLPVWLLTSNQLGLGGDVFENIKNYKLSDFYDNFYVLLKIVSFLVLGWAFIAVPFSIMLYFTLLAFLRKSIVISKEKENRDSI
ncbi:MAG: DUF2062 domain-containing protein [Cytophagales bacterium]